VPASDLQLPVSSEGASVGVLVSLVTDVSLPVDESSPCIVTSLPLPLSTVGAGLPLLSSPLQATATLEATAAINATEVNRRASLYVFIT
jgi:hypothetical protein